MINCGGGGRGGEVSSHGSEIAEFVEGLFIDWDVFDIGGYTRLFWFRIV